MSVATGASDESMLPGSKILVKDLFWEIFRWG